MFWHGSERRTGFTLVEVLLVVAIMAILAAVALPRMSGSSNDAKDATLMHNLAVLRKQIELFKAQHGGKAPGWQGTNVTLHLQGFTNASGAISFFASPNYPYGPYFLHGLPQNPFNSGTGFKASANPAGETPNHNLTASGLKVGWFYDKDTGRVAPNAEGSNANGVPRISF
jgi:general secretion pathway protein G